MRRSGRRDHLPRGASDERRPLRVAQVPLRASPRFGSLWRHWNHIATATSWGALGRDDVVPGLAKGYWLVSFQRRLEVVVDGECAPAVAPLCSPCSPG